MDQILLTREGYEKLEEECARLWAERDRTAEHLDAQHELERIEWRLSALERRLVDAEVVASRCDGIVEIGEAVIVLGRDSGQVVEYRIVGTGELDPRSTLAGSPAKNRPSLSSSARNRTAANHGRRFGAGSRASYRGRRRSRSSSCRRSCRRGHPPRRTPSRPPPSLSDPT